VLDRKEVTVNVERLLREYCQTQITLAQQVGDRYVRMWEEIDQYLLSGGKRIRPYLTIFAYEAYGGSDTESILSIASAWELLHACLLVHDDIIDRDTIRHGKLNIAGKYQQVYQKYSANDAPHYALSAALLAGDLLLSASYDMVNNSALNAEDKLGVQSYLHTAMFKVGGGELLDVESVLFSIAEADTLAICQYKTATYSFQLPLLCGANLAGAEKAELDKLEKLGLCLGIAFQLKDDLLGVFGQEATTGKSNRTDIFEKKRTYLLQTAIKHLPSDKAERLEKLYERRHVVTAGEAEDITTMIVESNADSKVQEQIQSYVAEALVLTESLAVSVKSKQIMTVLINKLAERVM